MINRKKFFMGLKKRLFLRLHMTVIVAATILSGLTASKLLFETGMTNIVIRYPLTVVISYAAFFGFIKLWLLFYFNASSASASASPVRNAGISIDLPDSGSGGGPGGGRVSFGGGSSGGGGADRSFAFVPQETAAQGSALPDIDRPDISSSGSGAGSKTCGFDFDFDLDSDAILFIVIAAAVIIAGGFLIYQAPAILSEAAFDSVLAASLARKTRSRNLEHWHDCVFKKTWIAFTVVLVITIICARYIHADNPAITKISDLFLQQP